MVFAAAYSDFQPKKKFLRKYLLSRVDEVNKGVSLASIYLFMFVENALLANRFFDVTYSASSLVTSPARCMRGDYLGKTCYRFRRLRGIMSRTSIRTSLSQTSVLVSTKDQFRRMFGYIKAIHLYQSSNFSAIDILSTISR
jgi:hypothetical protein